ncbi:MAG: hypothetical protein AAGI45_25125 [Cyanobacteria bacterium P01_H01_bin.26]
MQYTTAPATASQLLSDKVDSVLSTYPAEPYQSAFDNSAIRKLLLDYVECKLKQTMPSLDTPENWQRLPHYLHQSVDLELHLDSCIYWGIEYIVQNQLDLMLRAQSKAPSWSVQDMTQTCVPAHWFG